MMQLLAVLRDRRFIRSHERIDHGTILIEAGPAHIVSFHSLPPCGESTVTVGGIRNVKSREHDVFQQLDVGTQSAVSQSRF